MAPRVTASHTTRTPPNDRCLAGIGARSRLVNCVNARAAAAAVITKVGR